MPRVNITQSKQEAAPRLVWMDSLRGIAVLLVVLLHTVGLVREDFPDALEVVHFVNMGVAPFRMAILMMLSGMLLGRSLSKTTGVYVKGKLSHIGWPYLLWSCILIGLHTVTAPLMGNETSLEPWLRIFYNPTTPLWYLGYLLAYYFLCLVLGERARTTVMLCALGASVLMPSDPKRFLFLFAFFLLGDFIVRQERWWRWLNHNGLAVTAAAVSVALTFLVSAAGTEIRQEIVSVPGILGAMVISARLLGRMQDTLIGRASAYSGRQSMVFYVTHMPVLLVTYHALYQFGGVRNPWLLFGIAMLAVLGFGLVMSRLKARSRIVSSLFSFPRLRSTAP